MVDIIGEVDGKKFMVAVDAIIVANEKILLEKRINEPYKDDWALPGGRVDMNETLEESVVREAKEEVGCDVKVKKLVGVYSTLDRDPRGRNIGVAFECELLKDHEENEEGTEIKWFPLNEVPSLAFDHNKMIEDYLNGL